MAKFNFKVGDVANRSSIIEYIDESKSLIILRTAYGYTGCYLKEDGKGGWEVDKARCNKAEYHGTFDACKAALGVHAVPTITEQYNSLKGKHPDALLLFRCGDFYKTYFEDADKAALKLGITCHSIKLDGNTAHMAEFPHHALDIYLPKLVRAGFRIAICDTLISSKSMAKI